MTGVYAGETEAVHRKTLERCFEQYLVPVEGQADVLVTGIPYISPYLVSNVGMPEVDLPFVYIAGGGLTLTSNLVGRWRCVV